MHPKCIGKSGESRRAAEINWILLFFPKMYRVRVVRQQINTANNNNCGQTLLVSSHIVVVVVRIVVAFIMDGVRVRAMGLYSTFCGLLLRLVTNTHNLWSIACTPSPLDANKSTKLD